jgi:DNA-directed RNA polymerase subunit RPC12/RpoP
MSEKLMGKCNKCGTEYEAAPLGTIHKCGKCSGGRVVVEGRESFIEINIIDLLPRFPESKFAFSNTHSDITTRETVEQEICDYLLGNTNLPHHGIDPHTAAFIANQIISNRRYLGKDS